MTSSSVANDEVELIVTAARFFLDRLVPAVQQRKLTLNIEVTKKPGRTPIAVKWLVGSRGFFGWRSPSYFVMTVSVAAGIKDGFEVAANEIVHVAQTVTGRLKIFLKSRKVNGKREDAYAASWANGKIAFIDMTPRDNRLWEAEARLLKTQLVDEFLAWSAGRLKTLPTQKPKNNMYGLYAIRPQNIAAPVFIPPRSAPVKEEINQLSDVVEKPSDTKDFPADAPVTEQPNSDQQTTDTPAPDYLNQDDHVLFSRDESQDATQPREIAQTQDTTLPQDTARPTKTSMTVGQPQLVNHLQMDGDEFKIAVNVPQLGMDRMLDSAMLHVKLNDLLERGLIPHDEARAAFRQAQQNRIVR
ncbi:MAG: hypothetical protein VX106_02910 [Pseudomonadota bacterium]|nr:hypothetical protein [Pseudomonadota bacterium]